MCDRTNCSFFHSFSQTHMNLWHLCKCRVQGLCMRVCVCAGIAGSEQQQRCTDPQTASRAKGGGGNADAASLTCASRWRRGVQLCQLWCLRSTTPLQPLPSCSVLLSRLSESWLVGSPALLKSLLMLSMTVFIVYELQIWPKVDHNAQYLGCDIHQYIVHTPYYSVVRDSMN